MYHTHEQDRGVRLDCFFTRVIRHTLEHYRKRCVQRDLGYSSPREAVETEYACRWYKPIPAFHGIRLYEAIGGACTYVVARGLSDASSAGRALE